MTITIDRPRMQAPKLDACCHSPNHEHRLVCLSCGDERPLRRDDGVRARYLLDQQASLAALREHIDELTATVDRLQVEQVHKPHYPWLNVRCSWEPCSKPIRLKRHRDGNHFCSGTCRTRSWRARQAVS
jgi:hypothetical protein